MNTLLFIPDSTVISEALLSHLVKEALLHRIAVVGYNHFFMEIGAVLAFKIDYKGVGALGAKLAGKVVSGSSCRLHSPPFEVEWNQKAWDAVRQDFGRDDKSGRNGERP